MEAKQPLINQKLLIRSAICLFALAFLFAGYTWMKNRGTDVDLGSVESKGWIAAVQYTGSGTQAVIIKPDGTIMESKGYKDGAHDRDLAWRPDGNRVFFSSDRDENAFNIQRWNLATGLVDRRTLGKITKSDPSFADGGSPEVTNSPLIVFSGMAWELDPSNGKANQVVPPKTGKEQVDTRDETSGDKLSGGFGEGAAFKVREARFFGGRDWVAVIRRTDTGEVLSVQSMSEAKNHRPLAAGDKIFMDVDLHSGKLYYSVLNFQWPDPNNIPANFIKNGVVKKPFVHYISSYDPSKNEVDALPVIASGADNTCFANIAVSPDGTTLLCIAGEYKGSGEFNTKAMLSMPAASSSASQATRIYPAKGLSEVQLTNMSWSPDNKKVAFGIVDKNRERVVCLMDRDGSNIKELTKGKGNFGLPIFSPQN